MADVVRISRASGQDRSRGVRAGIVGGVLRRPAVDRPVTEPVIGLTEALTRHWLRLLTLSAALVLVGSLGVAYLRSVGASWLAEPLATAYLLLCPQRPDHAYFPFGAQMALEQREVALLGAQLLGGLLYGRVRGRLRPLDGRLVVLLSLPMAWDGFSQMAGLRASDWLTRTWTGGLFTLAVIAWAYPRLDRAWPRR